jgi:thioredoxin-like negative regulator of GroEL
MTGIALAALLQVTVAVSDSPYQEAVKRSAESGKPVLILIGAEWCHYCKIVERDVLPVLKKRGLMDRVEYVYLDYDRDRRLVGATLRGEIVPEMVMFRKTPAGWKRSDISGAYKIEEVEPFVTAFLKEAEKDAGAKKPEGDAPAGEKPAAPAEKPMAEPMK